MLSLCGGVTFEYNCGSQMVLPPARGAHLSLICQLLKTGHDSIHLINAQVALYISNIYI